MTATVPGTATWPDPIDEWRDSTREFFTRYSSLDRVRELFATDSGFDEEVWQRAAAEVGHVGLLIPEEFGGLGAALTELAVVAEEAGRALYGGPLLSTGFLATPLLLETPESDERNALLRSIAAGRPVTVAVATDDTGRLQAPVTAERHGAGWTLDGVVAPVVDAGVADVVLVPALADGALALFAVRTGEVTLRALESIDLTRRLYEVTFNQVAAQPLSLSDADAVHRYERAMDVVRTLVAAEQVGGAARSLELLVDYTGDRVQFDRPIASFQVVKHDAADLLADVTSARAALAEAIRRIVIRDDQAGRYAALAKAVAGRAFLTVAEKCIQYHGGIGFTWECDAHLFYRRAVGTETMAGDSAAMRRRIALDLDVGGTGAGAAPRGWALVDTIASTNTSEYDAVRTQAADWLRTNWNPELTTREWWARLAEAGWSLPQWPTEWGGRDLPGPLLPAVHDAFAEVGALWPPWSPGQHLAGPTVIHHGSQAQKELLLPALVTGEHFWAQLFSEPGAGSDLASLRTRAVKQPDGGWLVNGQKVWTTGATHAERGFLLARTDPSAPKHRGLSYFVLDMDTPGLDVRPIKQINGNAEFCEVFLTDVYIPPDRLIGEENGGWKVSLTSLGFERMAAPPVRVPAGAFGGLLDLPAGEAARRATSPHRDLLDFQISYELFRDAYRSSGTAADPVLEDELVRLYVDTELDQLVGGMISPGPGMTAASAGSISKLVSQRLAIRLRSLAWRIGGAGAALAGSDAPAAGAIEFMALTSYTENIAGGTEQIQRNIIAERVLGMPREPRP